MTRLNVDRMRRHKERSREHADRRFRRLWLDSLTPEHREKHRPGRICDDCAQAAIRRMGESLALAMRR